MPLPLPSPRKRIHTRKIEIHGFEREDGLWEIEGHLTDRKSYAFPNQYRGEIPAGEPIHDMSLRMTVDDNFVIQTITAVSDSTPFAICPGAAASYEGLKGLCIASGWRREIRKHVGDVKGCTHLTALLNEAATVAFQTIYPIRHREKLDKPATGKPGLLNSCRAFASDSDVVKAHWPDFYSGS
ncbi:MAG: hypothetical protein COA65_02550 [Rhodospirillaceae bacterium]|nr:MAG: hypothetical protein COA65_02550 [Rhodospirillaceae bacterium]